MSIISSLFPYPSVLVDTRARGGQRVATSYPYRVAGHYPVVGEAVDAP